MRGYISITTLPQQAKVAPMENDLLPFLAGVGLLVAYLFCSAATEMGTKWPWRNGKK